MNAPSKVEPVVNVHRKLSTARQRFHNLPLKKTGKNSFAGYNYFELGDFLIPALAVFDEVGLGATVSFEPDIALMRIVDLDNPTDSIVITSPMGSAALKGCHEVQNIGAVETYQRRYLWVAALEIVEHDALDATNGKIAPEKAAHPSAVGVIDEGQWATITQLIEASGSDAQAFCKYYGCTSTNLLAADKYDSAVASLNAKIAKRERANA